MLKEASKILANIKVVDDGCWLWVGDQTTNGYGRVQIIKDKKKKRIRAHRLSYEVFKESIPEGLYVCHSCDVKLCVNPEHLWLGTHQQNMQDAYDKGIIYKKPM